MPNIWRRSRPGSASSSRSSWAPATTTTAQAGRAPTPSRRIAAERRAIFARALGDVKRIGTGAAIQARCLECDGLGGSFGTASASAADIKLMDFVLAKVTQ